MKTKSVTRPSRTINRLHLSDLDPSRFEDLCLNLIYPLREWSDIRHYGRTGDDGGVDIYAVEKLIDGTTIHWYVQCRRYAKATKSTLIQAADDALGKAPVPPDILLVIVACDVQRSSHEAFIEYAIKRSVKQPLLWTQSILEAKLYSERPDLLFTYFGIGKLTDSQSLERNLRHKLAFKERMRRDFFKKQFTPDIILQPPWARFQVGEAIIRSFDDQRYPDIVTTGKGPSNWFKVELYNFYHNGLEVIVTVYPGIIDKAGHWAIIRYGQEFDETVYQETNIICVGQIPFNNIVDYDLQGDEYYNIPHIYCYFIPPDGPYERFKYVLDNHKQHWTLDNDFRFNYQS